MSDSKSNSIIISFLLYIYFAGFQPTSSNNYILFENTNHKIYFDDAVDSTDIIAIGNFIFDLPYFNKQENIYVKIDTSHSEYNLYVYHPMKYWSDSTSINLYHVLENHLSKEVSSKKINIKLIANTIFGLREKEIE